MISTFRRLAMSVAMAFILSLQASATQFIKEVMLIGGSKGADVSELDGLKQQLMADGWTFMNYDLNKGGYGCYIFMLYKADDNTDGINWGYITDFFMTNQSGTVPETFVNNGRTYHLVPYSGQWDFTSKQGNLNAGTGSVGEDIHLYYTKDPFPDNHAISTIFFSQWKDEPVVHLNGGSTLGDFNLGCTGYQDVFLHYSTGTVTPNQLPVSELASCSLELCKLSVSGWAYDPDVPAQSLNVKVSIYQEDGTTLYREENVTGNPGFIYNTIITDLGTFVVKALTTDINTNESVQIGNNQSITNNMIVLNDQTGELTLNDGDVLTGTGGANTHVTIAHGATIALYNVTITDITNDNDHKWAGITCAGNATIILVEGTTNNVKGGSDLYPGIQVGPSGTTLNIRGNGTLNTSSKGYGPGIGGYYKNYNINYGNIVIEGGIINATGGDQAAGIGGVFGCSIGDITISGGTITARGGTSGGGIGSGYLLSSCGNITITDNVTSVTAIRGSGAPDCIGKGERARNCGTVTIGGMVTGQIAQSSIIYKPADATANTITFNPNGGTFSTQNRQLYYYRPQSLTNSFTRTNYIFNGWNTAADGSGTAYADGQIVFNLGSTTFYAQWKPINYNIIYNLDGGTNDTGNPTTYTYESGNIKLAEPHRFHYVFDGWTWEGQNTPTKNVTISTGSTGDRTFTAHWTYDHLVKLNNDVGKCTLGDGDTITGTGGPDTHIIIADGATVTLSGVNITNITNDENHSWAGITCAGDAVIILANNTRNNLHGGYKLYPGIYVPEGKTLTIRGSSSGVLRIEYDGFSTAIGGGNSLNCGNIRIEGGFITVICNFKITSGGSVLGATGAAAIGGGGNRASCGNITITSGTVHANGGYGAGIGGSLYGSCGDITITGGTIKATSQSNAAGIGSAEHGTCGNITITGGEIIADSDGHAACIGSGYIGSCGNITITGGNITNRLLGGKATVGCDISGSCGTISIAPSVMNMVEVHNHTKVALAKEGYGTYYDSFYDAVLPAGMKARIITAKTGSETLTYQTVADGDLTAAATATVPAGTAVMLQTAPADDARNVTINLTAGSDDRDFTADNLLHGSDAATTTTGGDQFYKLSYNRDGAQKTIGWYWGAQNAGAFTSGAHKAWLALPSDGQHAPVMGIGLPDFFEGTTDVVIIAAPAAQDDVWYDIYGRELTGEPQAKGVYIHGGKTIMIK